MDTIIAAAFILFIAAMICYILFASRRLTKKNQAQGLETPFMTTDNAPIADHARSLSPRARMFILALVLACAGGFFAYAFFYS